MTKTLRMGAIAACAGRGAGERGAAAAPAPAEPVPGVYALKLTVGTTATGNLVVREDPLLNRP